jgi:hypothetical protein
LVQKAVEEVEEYIVVGILVVEKYIILQIVLEVGEYISLAVEDLKEMKI